VISRPPPWEGLFFDWNGTLLNDLERHYYAAKRIFEMCGVKPPTRDQYCEEISSEFWRFYYEHGISSSVTSDELNAMKNQALSEHEVPSAILQDDAIAVLAQCQRRNIRLFLVSGEAPEKLKRDIAHYGVALYFEGVWGGAHPKEIVLGRVLERSGIVPQRSCYVGDTVEDVHIARTLGMEAAAFTGGYASYERLFVSPYTYLLHSLADILGILRSVLVDKI